MIGAGVVVFLTYHIWLLVGCFLLFSCQRLLNHITATKSFILFHLSWHNLIKQTESLDLVVRAELESLLNVFPSADAYQNWLGIFCTNSFQLGQSKESGVFLKASRLNHSCRANCDYNIEDGCISVRSIRPVVAGEELTICYNNFLEEDGPVVKQDRRKYLLWAYRFSCQCEDCSLTGYRSKSNDSMRKRLVKLRKDWTLTQDFRQERRIVDEQIRMLLRLDSCGKVEYILQAVEFGWEAEMNRQENSETGGGELEKEIDKDRTEFVLRLGSKLSGLLYGVEHRNCRDWAERWKQYDEPS